MMLQSLSVIYQFNFLWVQIIIILAKKTFAHVGHGCNGCTTNEVLVVRREN